MAELIQPQMGLNFEQVWAAFMETRQQMKETQQETDRLIRELRDESRETDRLFRESKAETDRQMKETDRLFRESKAETDRQMKETDRLMKELQKSMGYLNNRFGELAEHLVLPNIVQKFNAFNYHFNDIAKERKFVNPDTGRVEAEFDLLLENDAYSIGVEVKAKPAEKDVTDHISRLEFLRRYKDQRGDSREIRGALAGAIMPEAVRKEALRAGLYVIEQSGDTVRIEEPNQLRSW
jgi:chromosome segregation ATPase